MAVIADLMASWSVPLCSSYVYLDLCDERLVGVVPGCQWFWLSGAIAEWCSSGGGKGWCCGGVMLKLVYVIGSIFTWSLIYTIQWC